MKKLKTLAIICALVMVTNVHAALQSRPGIAAKDYTTVSDFFIMIREMEAKNGVMGLNAEFETNLSVGEHKEISEPNNVDVHLCKNTEWGAAAMLADSDYGAGNDDIVYDYDSATKSYGAGASTTGNMSGIFGMHSGAAPEEYMSSGVVETFTANYNKVLRNAAVRYVDKYDNTIQNNYIPGDATYEVRTFKNSNYSQLSSFFLMYCRGRNSIFSMNSGFKSGAGTTFTQVGARACMWVGDGI